MRSLLLSLCLMVAVRGPMYSYSMPKHWHRAVAVVLYVYVLYVLFTLIDTGSHSGSETLVTLALPFIALTLLLGFAISEKKR